MTIQELAKLAGVTRRTIRYYVTEGLLPPPERGRPAQYNEEHVRRLELIQRLKEQHLPLGEIRELLERANLEDLEEVAPASPNKEATEELDANASGSSAAEYIAQVMDRGRKIEELKRQDRYDDGQPLFNSSAPPAPRAVIPAKAPLFAAEESQENDEIFQRSSTWQRIQLLPGVELHYLSTADGRVTQFVSRLLNAAAIILDQIPEKGPKDPVAPQHPT